MPAVRQLIADVDGVYDPANYNNRLLLGLKGTMSEAELHILQERMLAGRNAKARRGELGKPLPMGYLRRPSGEVALDPDEQQKGRLSSRSVKVQGTFNKLVTADAATIAQLKVARATPLPFRRALLPPANPNQTPTLQPLILRVAACRLASLRGATAGRWS